MFEFQLSNAIKLLLKLTVPLAIHLFRGQWIRGRFCYSNFFFFVIIQIIFAFLILCQICTYQWFVSKREIEKLNNSDFDTGISWKYPRRIEKVCFFGFFLGYFQKCLCKNYNFLLFHFLSPRRTNNILKFDVKRIKGKKI